MEDFLWITYVCMSKSHHATVIWTLEKCLFQNSRIVIFTVTGMSEGQGNEIDINYTEYNNTYPILS